VYVPAGCDVTLAIESGSYRRRYLDTETATWTDAGTVEDSTEVRLRPPDGKNWVAVFTATS